MSAIPPSPIVSRLPDPNMPAAPAALLRAAQRAQEIAARTGTSLVVAVDGKVIEKPVTLEPEINAKADKFRSSSE